LAGHLKSSTEYLSSPALSLAREKCGTFSSRAHFREKYLFLRYNKGIKEMESE